MALFEIIRDGTGYMQTDHVSCIYNETIIKQMAKAGYKFKLNGKTASAATVIQYVKDNTKKK